MDSKKPLKLDYLKLFLGPNPGNQYFKRDFVGYCINELLIKTALVNTGVDSFTSLEILAMSLLFDTAKYYGVEIDELASANIATNDLENAQ